MYKVQVVCDELADAVYSFVRVPVAGDVLHMMVNGRTEMMRVKTAYMVGIPLDAEDKARDMDLSLSLVDCKIIRKRKWWG